MAPLPLGAFDMGDATGKAPSFERPMHRVDIAYRLAVGRYEVTFEEWDACRADGGCKRDIDDMGWGRGRRPLINVGPEDAEAYLSWLRRKTGRAYRLLSEAEWEYAARAGSVSAWHTGNDPAALCVAGNGADASSAYAWRNGGCSDAFADRTAPVGSFQPNAFGLYDMIGNAWEWTADCWHANYEGAPANGSAWTTECSKPDRVLRGGAFSVDVDKMRSSSRYAFAAQPMPFFGFRVARPME
jgi:formylglycine-generating enzyme required for sulfatase activity